jgi:hypothetical protein
VESFLCRIPRACATTQVALLTHEAANLTCDVAGVVEPRTVARAIEKI